MSQTHPANEYIAIGVDLQCKITKNFGGEQLIFE